MEKIQFDLSELVKVPEKLRRKVFNEWVERALNLYALELERLVVEQIDRSVPPINYSGDLRKSIKSLVKKEVLSWYVKVGSGIISPFPYPVVVHEGAKPHWMPLKPLVTWVEKKLQIPKGESYGVAKAIQWKIAKKGKKGRPFMRIMYEQEKPRMAQKLSQYLAIAMRGGKL